MSTAGTEEPAGTEVIVAGETAGAEVVGGDNAGETAGESAGTTAGEEIVAGETAGEFAGEAAGESAGEMVGDTQCEEDPLPILPGGDCRLARFSCGIEYECIIPEDTTEPFECGCLDGESLNCCGTCDRESCDGVDQDCDGIVDEGVDNCESCLALSSSNFFTEPIESPLVISSTINMPSTKTIYISKCDFPPLNISSIEVEGQGFSVNVSPELPFGFSEGEGLVGETVQIDITYTPQGEEEQTGILKIMSNDATQPVTEVSLIGQVVDYPIEQCPTAQVSQDNFSAFIGSIITLDASPSFDSSNLNGRPVSYEWIVSNRPNGSMSSIVESYTDFANPSMGGLPDDTSTPEAMFFIDLPGIYQFELIVKTQEMIDRGVENCGTNTKSVYLTTSDEPGFRIVLTWDTPNDLDQTDSMGTDLDLHLRHPLSMRWATDMVDVYDCYFANRAPDWGNEGNENNPSLDVDDLNGAGPEQISYQDPEVREDLYRIGVHYYSNGGLFAPSYGPSTASIFVYFFGELVFNASKELIDKDHFWEPAAIRWGLTQEVIEIDRYYVSVPATSVLECTITEECMSNENCVNNLCQPATCEDNEGCGPAFCVDNRCVACVESTDCSEGNVCVSNQCFPQPENSVVCENTYNCIVDCMENSDLPEELRQSTCSVFCDLNTSGGTSQALVECLDNEGCEFDSLECMEERCLAEAVQCNLHLNFE